MENQDQQQQQKQPNPEAGNSAMPKDPEIQNTQASYTPQIPVPIEIESKTEQPKENNNIIPGYGNQILNQPADGIYIQAESYKVSNTSSNIPPNPIEDPRQPQQHRAGVYEEIVVLPHLNYPRQVDDQTYPTIIKCPNCNVVNRTRVDYSPGQVTYLYSFLLCLLFFPFLLIPFCLVECLDNRHYCRNCGQLVGVKEDKCC